MRNCIYYSVPQLADITFSPNEWFISIQKKKKARSWHFVPSYSISWPNESEIAGKQSKSGATFLIPCCYNVWEILAWHYYCFEFASHTGYKPLNCSIKLGNLSHAPRNLYFIFFTFLYRTWVALKRWLSNCAVFKFWKMNSKRDNKINFIV